MEHTQDTHNIRRPTLSTPFDVFSRSLYLTPSSVNRMLLNNELY